MHFKKICTGHREIQFSSVQSLSHVRLFATPWKAARQASLSITNSRSSLRLAFIKSVMPSSHLILGRPLLRVPWIRRQILNRWTIREVPVEIFHLAGLKLYILNNNCPFPPPPSSWQTILLSEAIFLGCQWPLKRKNLACFSVFILLGLLPHSTLMKKLFFLTPFVSQFSFHFFVCVSRSGMSDSSWPYGL